MKRMYSIATAFVVVCIATFTGYKVYDNQPQTAQELLIKKNLEALTDYEHGFHVYPKECWDKVWCTYETKNMLWYCQGCTEVYWTMRSDSDYCNAW